MREEQRVALLEVRLDRLLVELGLDRVRSEDHDHVGFGSGSRRIDDPQSRLLRLRATTRSLNKPDSHVDT